MEQGKEDKKMEELLLRLRIFLENEARSFSMDTY